MVPSIAARDWKYHPEATHLANVDQVHSEDLAAVLGIVMAHQAPAHKSALVLRLLSALVLPDPEHYRALLRRLAALEGAPTNTPSWGWTNVSCMYMSLASLCPRLAQV